MTGSQTAESLRATAAVRALTYAVVAATAAYIVTTIPGVRPHAGFSTGFDAWLGDGALFGGMALCLARAALVRTERVAWAAIGAGIGLWTAGRVVYLSLAAAGDVPTPSLADVGWFAFYPAVYLALILLVRSRIPRWHASMWLDGLVGGLAVAAVTAAVLIAPVASATGGDRTTVEVTLAYPLGDLVLIALIAGVAAAGGWRAGRGWALLGGGLAVFAIGDGLFAYGRAEGWYHPGTPISALWPLATTLLALAAWQRPHILPVSWAGLRAVVVPVLCTGAALGVLVYDHFGAGTSVGFGLACGTIVAAMARTLLTFREVRTLAETRIEARTDDLTGLTNRRYLVRLLEEAVAGDKGGGVTLLLVDLDHFKELNDTLGHAAGDELLRRIGPRLESALGPGDLLARLGGDEFGVLMPTGDVATATATAGRIRTSLEQPFDLLGISIQVGASVGVASTTEHGHDAATLLQRSDVAMYIAKERHTGVEVYDADRDRNDRDRLALAGQMRAAIASGEFVVHYQPKLDLRDDRIRSVEALVRWEHPVYGRLAPDAFLPIAEQTNQMPALTELVIEQALADASAWRGAGFELEVAINLSASNLLDKGLPKAIAARLAAHGIAGGGLRVEVTENSVLADPARSIAVLGELRAQGVGVSIDDFGTGQASLAYLTRLPADELKIDRVFVCDLATNPTNAAIVRSTCDLAEAIGLVVVGEGVEDGAALECLRELGCRRAQGFHIGMPMPAREVTGLLTRRAADGSATLTTG